MILFGTPLGAAPKASSPLKRKVVAKFFHTNIRGAGCRGALKAIPPCARQEEDRTAALGSVPGGGKGGYIICVLNCLRLLRQPPCSECSCRLTAQSTGHKTTPWKCQSSDEGCWEEINLSCG